MLAERRRRGNRPAAGVPGPPAERRLGGADFHRVSRAALVRLQEVKEVVPLIGGHGQVRMRGGATLAVSRRRMKELLRRLEG